MPKNKGYTVTGIVNNLVAPIVLPSDNKQYFVFGFTTVGEPSIHNCVFYIRFSDPNGPEMCAKVAHALASKRRLTVSFAPPPVWDRKSDPSYVINGVKERKRP
jgi:hypothetical protein